MSELEQEGLEPESVVDEPAVEETPAAEEQPFAISREEWETTQNYLRATAPLLQEVQRLVQSGQMTPAQGQQVLEQNQQAQAPEYDPFEPESVNRFIQHTVGQMLEQALQEQFAPFQGLLGMVASEKGEQLARQEMEAIQGEIGEFDQDLAYVIAAPMIDSGSDPGQAFRQVANYLRQRDEQIRNEAYEKFKSDHEQGLLRLANAPGEQGGGAIGQESMEVPTGPNRYKIAVQRGLARRAVNPVG